MKDKKPKIYSMNECDTVIAYSKKQAIEWYFENGGTCESREDIAVECQQTKDLSQKFWWNCYDSEDLWIRIKKLKEGEEIMISRWHGAPGYFVTFQYVIDNLLDKFSIPGIICSTEY